ncbi:MAG: hypothetical protein ACI87E_005151 [Mariniblastus sp.]|jgi:hypothetical protein
MSAKSVAPKSAQSFPVVTFERFMLAGDSYAFPMSFVFELELVGTLDRQRLSRAMTRCMGLHPILFSRLSDDGKRWVYSPPRSVKAQLVVDEEDYRSALRFDLDSEIGLRCLIRESSPGHWKIGFAIHHACTDGLGAFQFIQDVSVAYRNDVDVETASPNPDESIEYLRRHRNSYGNHRFWHWLRWPIDLVGMVWTLEMFMNRPGAIVPCSADGFSKARTSHSNQKHGENAPARDFDSLRFKLTQEETTHAKRLAKLAGQSLNDRILESVFLAIQDWYEAFNPDQSNSLIRLMVPMNLRKSSTASAANMVAMVNFDRKIGRWRSKKWLRKLLIWEMKAVKRMRAGVTANRFLQLQYFLLGKWPMQARHDRCFATGLVSNLGELSRTLERDAKGATCFGTLAVEGFHCVAPLRHHSNVFFAVFTYLDQLHFSLTFNAGILEPTHVESLMEKVRSHLLHE